MIHEIEKTIEMDGLKEINISCFNDQHMLSEFHLDNIAAKAKNCAELGLSLLSGTTSGNRSALIEFAGNVCATSKALDAIQVTDTYTTAQEGAQFLKKLCGSSITTFQVIDLYGNSDWFSENQQSVDLLVAFIAKQPKLHYLELRLCGFTDSQ